MIIAYRKLGEQTIMATSTILPKELFECPICYKDMKLPVRIFQCKMGHSICGDCKDKSKEVGHLKRIENALYKSHSNIYNFQKTKNPNN